MRHALDRVLNRVGKVIHRVDAPFVPRLVMAHVLDAIQRGIAHVDIRRRHVDLGAEGFGSVRKLASSHPLEKIEVFRNGTIAIRAVFTRLRERAAIGAHLVLGEFIHIGNAFLDELDGEVVALVKV